ncbi:MAG: nucleotidyltransferase family protein [Prevotella sp.]|nr:nucleotidyltransferase family protein [Prevotella sp.]
MKQAMVFAAGLGTRLKPLTDTMPKALVEVGGKPLLWHVLTKLKQAGFEHVVVNVHHFSQQIVDYIEANNHFGIDLDVSDESGMLLETGGGIKKALPLFDANSPILIHNVDILSNVDLAALYDAACSENIDAMLLVSWRDTKRYLLFDEQRMLKGWTNIETGELKPHDVLTPTEAQQLIRLAFSGIHVLSPSVLPLFDDMPERFGIMDFYLKYCRQFRFKGKEIDGLHLIDVGKLDTLAKAEAELAKHAST